MKKIICAMAVSFYSMVMGMDAPSAKLNFDTRGYILSAVKSASGFTVRLDNADDRSFMKDIDVSILISGVAASVDAEHLIPNPVVNHLNN